MDKIISQLKAMKHSPVKNYVIPGLTSWMVGQHSVDGTVRLFENERNHQEQITPHSHRFNFTCLVLAGTVKNLLWISDEKNGDMFARRTLYYKGDIGEYQTEGEVLARYSMLTQTHKEGDTYSMMATDIHSIQFSRGAKVLFFEGPTTTNESVILLPYVGGEVINTFKVEDWMFKRN